MSDLLGPSDKENIVQVNKQLGDLITDIKEGKQNMGLFFSIGQQLAALCQADDIPVNVKLKLHAALQDMQSQTINNMDATKIIAAKNEIDDALDSK